MKTINRIKDVFVRLKLRRESYMRRASFVALMSILLISFQNCSQGKFEIEEAQNVSASKSSNDVAGSGGNTGGTGGTGGTTPTPPVVEPPVVTPPVTPVGPTAQQVADEIARRNRCKSAVKDPIFVNEADFNNKVVNVKSGLATGSGDMGVANAITATVDASHGIDTSKYNPTDGCIFQTRVFVQPVNESGRVPTFNHGIGVSGDQLTAANAAGALTLITSTIQRRVGGGNNNNDNDDYVAGNHSISTNFNIAQVNNNDVERATRCVEGSLYYRVFIQTESDGLADARPTYPTTVQIGDVVKTSVVRYVKVESENNCWKEYNLGKIMQAASASSVPPANALLGTSAAFDGEWATAVSQDEGGTGYIYIFRKVSGTWTFFQKIKGANGNGTKLTGVALKNGLLVIASAGDGLYRLSPPRPGYPGRVFVYNLSGALLTTPVQIIDNPLARGTKFGSSVAIAGNSIAIGDSANAGIAYLFNLNNGLYGAGTGASRTESASKKGEDINAVIKGYGSNIVYQGGRLLVGAYNGNESYAGSVHLYDVGGGSFGSPVDIFAPSNITAKGNFGYSMAFDGTALVVGAYENETGGNAAGAVVIYKNYTDTAVRNYIQGSAAEERFGVSVVMSDDHIFIGSRGGTGSSGTLSRFPKTNMDTMTMAARTFVQRSHDAKNGEGFTYSMGLLSGESVPTILVTSQTKDYTFAAGDTRSKAGNVYIYEVKQ